MRMDAPQAADTTKSEDASIDAALVQRARRGDGEALDELVTRHQRHALAIAISLVREPADAGDLTQESFLRAFRNLDLLADPEKFAPWLGRVVFGTCVDWLRGFHPELFQSTAATDEDFQNIPASEPAVLESIERAELVERVTRALASLPPRYRVPLRMYHLDGLSHERVAAALGVPPATVRSLVHRARRKLAALLGDLRADAVHGDTSVFDPRSAPHTMLHILNGDSTRMSLEQSGVPGLITVWGDVLYVGPVPRDVDDDTFADIRAGVWDGDFISRDEALATGRRWNHGMEMSSTVDEVVLWFEHDLHDQLLLVRQLDWFARRPVRPPALSLICIGEFPSVTPFYGLGQLTPEQLASLLDTRQRVSERQLALGQSMWRAFTGDDPTAMERVLARDTSSLPFLDGAMRRLFEDFPAVGTGLPRTERSTLEILESHGEMSFGALFPRYQKTEERVFMGDWTFWSRLVDLARGDRPLIRLDHAEMPEGMLGATVAITDNGRRVLAGDDDWMAIAPFERWIGGVHLTAPNVAWRWSPADKRLVYAPIS